MSDEIKIGGQPIEIKLDWAQAQSIVNIEKAVDKIQAAIGDSWASGITAQSAPEQTVSSMPNVDMVEITAAFKTALRDALQEVMAQAANNDNNNDEPTNTPVYTDDLRAVFNNRKWNHKVITSKQPPNENLLDEAGVRGYELVNTVYDPAKQAWITYLKKLVSG